MKTKRPHVCIDRLLPRDIHVPQHINQRGIMRAISPIGKAWPNGSLLRIRFMGGTTKQQQITLNEAMEWPKYANLRFEVTTDPNAEIRITFDQNDGAWSYIGTDCRSIPSNQPTMNLGFLDPGTAMHEFGHTIALAHEHQNPDGGIQWNEANVIRDLEGPPNNWDEATIRSNVLEKYQATQINGTKFDPASIMLYFFPASWTLNGVATKQNTVLSGVDEAFVASAKMYPKSGPTSVDAVVLQTNGKSVKAAIGKPGEEDLFTFSIAKDGRYSVETGGNTDMFMKLYGPENDTNLIAQDDDSGAGLNAKIVSQLRAGKYLVQVRHFRPTGTGNYTIKVGKA